MHWPRSSAPKQWVTFQICDVHLHPGCQPLWSALDLCYVKSRSEMIVLQPSEQSTSTRMNQSQPTKTDLRTSNNKNKKKQQLHSKAQTWWHTEPSHNIPPGLLQLGWMGGCGWEGWSGVGWRGWGRVWVGLCEAGRPSVNSADWHIKQKLPWYWMST